MLQYKYQNRHTKENGDIKRSYIALSYLCEIIQNTHIQRARTSGLLIIQHQDKDNTHTNC